jgi:hypothetical protein
VRKRKIHPFSLEIINMGIEQLVSNELEPGMSETIFVSLRFPHYVNTVQQQIIVDEALRSGLSPDHLFLLIALVQRDEKGIIEIVIGDLPPPSEYIGSVWGIDTDLSEEGFGDNTFIRAFHLMLSAPGNPLEVHWRQQVGREPTVSIEGIERVKKTTDVAKYTSKLARLLPRITNHLRPRGRPEDSTAYTEDEAIKRVIETERLSATGKYTLMRAAAIAFDVNNEESAYKMYRRYKEKWLPE